MADPHPDGGFDLNKDVVGLDLNVPVLEEDAREVQRLPAVEVYLHNPIDWDELHADFIHCCRIFKNITAACAEVQRNTERPYYLQELQLRRRRWPWKQKRKKS